MSQPRRRQDDRILHCQLALTDEFLLGRLLRIIMMNERNAKAEVSQLAKNILAEDGIAAWDTNQKALTYHVFHCDALSSPCSRGQS